MRVGYLCLCSIAVIGLYGCGGGDADDQENQLPKVVVPSPDVMLIATLANQQALTLNNPWSQSDLDRMNVNATHTGDIFMTRIFENDPSYGYGGYKDRYAECMADYNLGDQADGNRKCYPRLAIHHRVSGNIEFGNCTLDPNIQRYGYYCGGGHGDNADSPKPKPMDPVDACCRYHDLERWAEFGRPTANEQGIVMCLSMAQASPRNLLNRADLANIEEARQCWYDSAITLIGGNQPDDAPPPAPY